MERAHVRAWPALRTSDVSGWLWRSSGGGSQRANSVSTIDFNGRNPSDAVVEVEQRYRAVGAPARFQTFDDTSPPGLDDVLRDRGYGETESTLTMFKRGGPAATDPAVEARDEPWAEWLDVYLSGVSESRRTVNTLILNTVPAPRAFFGCRRDGRIVASALGVAGFGCVVVECVATRPDARRQGAGRAVLAGLEAWAAGQDADWIGLQVVASNTPAVRLYEGIGFTAGATNRFWVKPD